MVAVRGGLTQGSSGSCGWLFSAAALAASVVALGVHAAEGSADFAASKGAGAEAQLEQRMRERVRAIPGTDTQYFIGGYLQLDGFATRKQQDGDATCCAG